jgi:hypothetical protein
MQVETFEETHLHALFYGNSGSGKTHLLGTCMLHEDTSPLLVLNARGQPITFRNFPEDKRPLVLTVESMEDFNDIYAWVSAGQPVHRSLSEFTFDAWGSDAWLEAVEKLPTPFNHIYKYLHQHNTRQFKSLGIDSITQVQRISSDTVYGKASSWRPSWQPPKTSYSGFHTILGQMTKLADYHFQLDVHVIMTALERHNEMPTLGITKYYPFLWGQSSLEVPSYAECVGRLINIDSLPVQKVRRMKSEEPEEFRDSEPYNALLLKGGRDYIAKWQGVSGPPDVIVNPTIGKLMHIFKQ